MAAETAIGWTRSTFNPWEGCTKVAPECDNCYAHARDVWLHGGRHWGPGAPRRHTSRANWRKPRLWNAAQRGLVESGHADLWMVFGGSLMDWADNEIDPAWRAEYWDLIRETPYLTWLLLTKRAPNIERMLPADWSRQQYGHVWLGTTAGTQARIDTDAMRLLDIDSYVSFLSIEPMLEAIDLRAWLAKAAALARRAWVIVGGESGKKARLFRRAWAESAIRQCRAAQVPVFCKQMGSFVVDRNDAGFDGCEDSAWPLRPDGCDPELDHEIYGYQERYQGADCRIRLVDRAGADPAEWPESLRVQQFPA